MKEFTIRLRMGEKQFQLIEKIVNSPLPDFFKTFMTRYAGLSLEEDCYRDGDNRLWIVAAFDDFMSMHALAKEFKENGWGMKVPFAHDQGGWHYCLSFDEDTFGKVVINRWTDHSPEDQFVVVSDIFDNFINGLQRRPQELL